MYCLQKYRLSCFTFLLVGFVFATNLLTSQPVLSYTVTFDLGAEGTLISGDLNQTVNEGGTAIAPEFSVAEGWAFIGWDKSFNNVTEDLLVTAQYVDESLAGILKNKVIASDGAAYDNFGHSVSVSGDTAVIGAHGDSGNRGSAYVFVRTGDSWVEQAKLTASDGAAGDYFGYSVSVSGDTAIIGAFGESDNGVRSGSAYVFVRSGGSWSQQTRLRASDGRAGGYFGSSVSLSGDTAVVGSWGDDNLSGSAYIFVRGANGWTQQAKLTADDGAAKDEFGRSVSVHGDIAVIGAYLDDDDGIDSGSAYVFVRNEDTWSQEAKLKAINATPGDHFGHSVSISGDTAVIGNRGNDYRGMVSGSAHVFVRNGGDWVEQAKLLANDGREGDAFGYSVCVRGDIAVIGAYRDDDNGVNSGSAYVYVRSKGIWIQHDKLIPSDGATYDEFGKMVSISGDTLVVGANGEGFGRDGPGKAYLYDLGVAPFSVTFDLAGKGSYSGGGALTQSVIAGTAAIAPAVSANAGWYFAGWNVPIDYVNSDLTVTAQYVPASTVTFDLDGKGMLIAGDLTQMIGVGFPALVPEVLGNPGWYFTGWDVAFDNITSDLIVTAQYVPGNAVTFNLDGKGSRIGGGALAQTVVDGTAAQPPRVKGNQGWHFTGWDVVFDNVTSDLTVTAEYGPAYTVTFQLGAEGTGISGNLVQNVGAGNTAIAPEFSVAEGWAFIGWDKSYHNVTEDLVVTAQYVDVSLAGVLENKVIARDGKGGDRFGRSVSISGDLAVIGSPRDNSAYVFVRNENGWGEQAKLTASDGAAGDLFGWSVSISGDTVLIGACEDDDIKNNSGSAYVFVRNGNRWTEQAKLLASDGAARDLFGWSVSVSGDTAVIGAYGDEYGDRLSNAYVFVRSGDSWIEQTKLIASDGATGDLFGWSVGVSGDTVVVGAHGDDFGDGLGNAYVFVRSEDRWIEQAKLTASDGAKGDFFGKSVSVSGDTVLVGAYGDDNRRVNSGSAYIFMRSGSSWTEQVKLTASDGATDDWFGSSVSSSGDTVVIGAWGDDDNGSASGSVYFYDLGVAPFSVTFDLDGKGSHIEGGSLTQTVIAGTAAIAPAVSANAGWYFAGWDVPIDYISSDLTVTAQYVIPYTVTFDLAGKGTLIAGDLIQTVGEGFAAKAPVVAGNSDWHFVGWDVAFNDIMGDLNVTAQYVPTYTVTFDLGAEGTLLSGELSQIVPEGSTAIAPEFSVATGSVFVGWDKSYHNVTEDLVVRAQYVDESLAAILENKEIASDGAANGNFGRTVSVSGDAALIGAKDIVYVFVRDGGSWTEQAQLTESDSESGDFFGSSVSISGDTAVIGAYGDDDNGDNSGSAYVFVRSGGIWTQQAKLTASDGGLNSYFGASVSVSGDTALIGAWGDDDLSGSAYIFARGVDGWTQQAKLTASDSAADVRFGRNVSISGDTALISAFVIDENRDSFGRAYVFVRDGGSWTEQAQLTESDDSFGGSLCISGDTALIGVSGDNGQGDSSGSAYVFVRSEGVWTEQAKLTASDGAAGDFFGSSVSLNGDTALIGAKGDDGNRNLSGSAYVFARSGDVWTPKTKLTASDAAIHDTATDDRFGSSVSLSGDTALIGAKGDDEQDSDSGSVYFYDLGAAPFTVTFDLDGKGAHTGGGALTQTVYSSTAITVPVVMSNAGWHFTGWDVDFERINRDRVVTAQYVPTYTVTFNLGSEGSLINGNLTQIIPAGSTAIAPELSVAAGMIFTGWDKSYHNVTQDLVVNAQYVDASLAGILERKGIVSDGGGSDQLGGRVSISGDTAVIGARADRSAYVLVRNEDDSWIQQAKLTISNRAVGDLFGGSVSIHGDTVVVGASRDDENGEASGSAYVFVRNGESWTQQAKLTASDGTINDRFGNQVSIHGDTAVISAPNSIFEDAPDSVYVFIRSGSSWTEQAKLIASDSAALSSFGNSVSISGDTAVIGASAFQDEGSAYVFVRSQGVWSEQAKLTASDGSTYNSFGNSVSVSGEIVVIGAPQDDDRGSSSGSAYVFVRSGDAWSEQAKLVASDGAGYDYFGMSVSIHGDTVVIGADEDDDRGDASGSAYVFVRNGESWTQQAKLTASDGAQRDSFGRTVSISGDTAVIGASNNYTVSGSAYFYDLGVAPFTVTFDLDGKGSHTGGGVLTQTVIAGHAAIAPTVTENSGWYFTGWDVAFDNITSDLTVTAQYVPVYTVTFDLGAEGTLLSGDLSQTVNEGGTVIAPEFSVAEGWAFIGWDKSYHNVTEDLVVNAQYVPTSMSTFTVTFAPGAKGMLLSGDLVQNVRAGGTAIAPELSVTNGWALIGWDKSYHNITEDLVVNAQYVDASLVGILKSKGIASDGATGDSFGSNVSISGDTALIGASGDDDQGDASGSAYVFVRNGNNWTVQAKLTASDGAADDEFGVNVSISGDTAVVGAHKNDEQGDDAGSAYVFVRNDGVWAQQAKLLASDGTIYDNFGFSVSVSDDTVVIGAFLDDDNGDASGSAYVFVRDGNSWLEQAKLTANDVAPNDIFGYSVSVSGNTALIGAGAFQEDGSAYVFVREGDIWAEQAKLSVDEGAEWFGHNVSLSGNIAVIGAPGPAYGYKFPASAYIFMRSGDTWRQHAKLTESDDVGNDRLGWSVGVSGDTAVIGADSDNNDGIYSGSAYFYDLGAAPITVTFELDGKGTRAGGGELMQLVKVGTDALAPSVEANAGWLFDSWDSSFANVTEDLTVTAQYMLDPTAPDADADGMIDGWEMTYFGSVNASDGLGDWDGDGMLDVDEFATGHDPNDGSDFFHVVNLSFIQGLQEVTLTFTSSDNHPNRRYHIFYSDELINPIWTASPLGPIIPDAGDRTTRVFTLPIVAPNRMFFKVDCSLD